MNDHSKAAQDQQQGIFDWKLQSLSRIVFCGSSLLQWCIHEPAQRSVCQGLKSPVWWIWWRIEFRYFQIARNIRRQMDGYLLVHLVFFMRCFSRERFFGQHRWKQPPLANHHRAILSPEFSRAWRGERNSNVSAAEHNSSKGKVRLVEIQTSGLADAKVPTNIEPPFFGKTSCIVDNVFGMY